MNNDKGKINLLNTLQKEQSYRFNKYILLFVLQIIKEIIKYTVSDNLTKLKSKKVEEYNFHII